MARASHLIIKRGVLVSVRLSTLGSRNGFGIYKLQLLRTLFARTRSGRYSAANLLLYALGTVEIGRTVTVSVKLLVCYNSALHGG